MAQLIVIEGLDGSGKATQAALLCKILENRGERVVPISFPDYQKPSSALVQMYLAGEIGEIDEVNPYAASTFYAADRYISYMTSWKRQYLEGYTIVADRYTTSNAAHQMAKLPEHEWDGYLDWLYDYEFAKMKLPAPDQVIYLDMHPDVSRKLMDNRYGGDASKRDIHEANLQYLIACRTAALYAANRLDWKIINCCHGDELLSINQVTEKIIETLNE